MRSFPHRLAGLALACALAAVAFAASNPRPESEAKDKTESAADKIRKALDQTLDLEIADQPLNLAVNQLREQTKLNFVLDRVTLANMGVDPDQSPVNVKLTGVKVRSALRTLLAQYNLSYAVVGDSVIITTEEVAMFRQIRQRVNLDLDRVQLGTALKQLAKETGTNLVVDSRVLKESQTAVTLQLEDVPLDTAVRLMAEMAGLKPVRVGNVLFVTSKASANELRADPDLAPSPQPNPNGVMMWNGIGMPFGPGGVGVPLAPPPLPPAAVPAGGDAPAPPAPPAEEKKDEKKPDEKKPDEKKPDDKKEEKKPDRL